MANVQSTFASVDWLTVTAKTQDARDRLLARAQVALTDAQQKRLPVRPWHFKGYHGWMSEHFRTGARADSDIVILSGNACACYWQEFVGLGENVSRIDLAVTTELVKADDRILLGYWDALEDFRANGKPPKFTWTMLYNSKGGQTLYVGSRTSEQMGRIYDKGIESEATETAGKIWRYEVEIKKPVAKSVAMALSNVITAEEMGPAIGGYVYDWFKVRRLKPVFPQADNILVLETEVKSTSDDARLTWLTTQVRPSVKGLSERGRLPEVLKALELDGLVTMREFIIPREGKNATQKIDAK